MTASRTFSSTLSWLRHAGTPLARPTSVLIVQAGLLITTLIYIALMLGNSSWRNALSASAFDANITPEGMALIESSWIHQALFLAGLLLAGLWSLARGGRFSRGTWLLLLAFVSLGDFSRILLAMLSWLSDHLGQTSGTGLTDSPWGALPAELLVGASYTFFNLLLFLPPTSNWYRMRKQLRQKSS